MFHFRQVPCRRFVFSPLLTALASLFVLAPRSADAQHPHPGLTDVVELCDQNAAHPSDPEAPGPGVRPSLTSHENHCEAAAYENPDVPRFRYQRARVALWTYHREGVRAVAPLAALRELKEQGYVAARYTLAQYYVVDERYPQALEEYRELWQLLEDPVGLLGMATMTERGWGVPRDADGALALYAQAADAGQLRAQTLLGLRYLGGRGVPQNDQRAAAYLVAAAEQGDPFAQTYVGFLFREGRGVAVDTARSVEMFTRAADAAYWGHEQAIAQAEMGFAYLDGNGVMKDDEQARRYLWSARVKGHERAKLQAALMMAAGRGFSDGMEMARREISSLRVEARNPVVKQTAVALFDTWCGSGRGPMPDGCMARPFTWGDLEPDDDDRLAKALLLMAMLPLFLDGDGDSSAYAASNDCNVYSAFDPCSPVHWEMTNYGMAGW